MGVSAIEPTTQGLETQQAATHQDQHRAGIRYLLSGSVILLANQAEVGDVGDVLLGQGGEHHTGIAGGGENMYQSIEVEYFTPA